MAQYGSAQYGSSQYGPSEQISDAIDKSELMPIDAKQAIKDFLQQTFNDLWESIEDILNIDPPSELLEKWDLLIQLVQSLLQ